MAVTHIGSSAHGAVVVVGPTGVVVGPTGVVVGPTGVVVGPTGVVVGPTGVVVTPAGVVAVANKCKNAKINYQDSTQLYRTNIFFSNGSRKHAGF